MKVRTSAILALAAGCALLAGCAMPPAGMSCRDTPNPTQCRNQRRDGNVTGGALLGGAGGAVIGALTGNAAEGTAIGAGAGALAGALKPEGTRRQNPTDAYRPGTRVLQVR